MNFTLSRAQKLIIAGVVIVPLILFSLYTWATLSYTYSSGDRAGYVQKFSRKGWLWRPGPNLGGIDCGGSDRAMLSCCGCWRLMLL